MLLGDGDRERAAHGRCMQGLPSVVVPGARWAGVATFMEPSMADASGPDEVEVPTSAGHGEAGSKRKDRFLLV